MMSNIKLSAAAAVAALAIGTAAPALSAPAFHGAPHGAPMARGAAPMARGAAPNAMAAVPRTGPNTQFRTGRNFAPPRNFSGVDRDRDRDRRRFRGRGFAFVPGYYDYGYAYDDSCYVTQWTPYGYRYVYVCGDYDY
jgi:hypothetical protein